MNSQEELVGFLRYLTDTPAPNYRRGLSIVRVGDQPAPPANPAPMRGRANAQICHPLKYGFGKRRNNENEP
jgi:hypothetical protein